MEHKELIACFTEQGFRLDFDIIQGKASISVDKGFEEDIYKKYLDNHYKMLFYFGFTDDAKNMSPSMMFLHSIASKFINSLSKVPEIEFTRENTRITPNDDEIFDILHSVPYVVGLEFINVDWIKAVYQRLSEIFCNEIIAYQGSVSEFMSEHNSRINIVGRVFFHYMKKENEFLSLLSLRK